MQHFKLPLTLTANGALATVEQDSTADISQSVEVLISTRIGERRSVPDYGIPDQVFGVVDANEITEAISQWEERADLDFVREATQGATAEIQIDGHSPGDVTYFELDTEEN